MKFMNVQGRQALPQDEKIQKGNFDHPVLPKIAEAWIPKQTFEAQEIEQGRWGEEGLLGLGSLTHTHSHTHTETQDHRLATRCRLTNACTAGV